MDKYISDRVYLEDIAGLCVSIRKGKETFTKAYGYKDYISKEPLNMGDVFHCSSATKILTASSAMDFDISMSVKEVLPWLNIDKRITIEMLLSHTSGIGDYKEYCWNEENLDEKALRRNLESDPIPILAEPGSRFIYSNIGYDIIGACISELSQKSYEEYIQDNVFDALGMKKSSLITSLRTDRESFAHPHIKDSSRNIIICDIYPYSRAYGPSSCLTAPVSDVALLADYRMKNMTYDESRIRAVVPDTKEGIGLGWFIRTQKGRTLYGHEGSDIGFRSSLWICPEEDMHIVLLSNISNAPLKKLSKGIFDILT